MTEVAHGIQTEEAAPHHVRWTPELVDRFWDWYSSWSEGQEFFSRRHGRRVIEFAQALDEFEGKEVLDFGTGPGWLIDQLLDAGARATGIEASDQLVRVANARLAGRAGFQGVHRGRLPELPFPAASFDVAFALEVVEHLLDDDVDVFFAEMRRILRPGGLLVVSTPNEERLAANTSLCPECGAIFHRMQHVQSWSTESLPACAARFDFETVAVQAVSLAVRSRRARALARVRRLLGLGPRPRQANLLFAGRSA